MEFHNNIEFVPINTILPNKLNANVMLNHTFEALKNNIEKNGFIGAILVRNAPLNQGKYEIIDGEKRFEVLKELGSSEVPVIVLNYNDINSTINSIRFNREHGYFDKEKIEHVLNDLINKTNRMFVRETLKVDLKEWDLLLNDNESDFSEEHDSDGLKYTQIMKESEKSKKLFY